MKKLFISFILIVNFVAPTKSLLAQTSSFFSMGQKADIMLAGFGFNKSGGALFFNHCAGIASDSTHLLLADRWNNRVLIWNTIPDSNKAPDIVLGQPNFNTNHPGTGLNEFNWPSAVSVSPDGKVVVADSYNNRILIWNSFPTQNGQAADIELAQMNAQFPVISWPWGVWTDGQKLVVAATDVPNKVYVWNTFPTQNNQNYDFALTASGHFGTPRTITSNGTFLMVGDHNPKLGGQNVEGDFVWTSFPTGDVPYDYFMSAPIDPNFAWLQGDIKGDTLLAVGRYLYIWNTLPQSVNQPPDLTVNFDFDGGDYTDVAFAGGKVFISGQNASRVFVFNGIPTQSNQTPDFILGSGDVNTNPLVTNNFISNPVPVSNGQSLFVTSDFNSQLFVWKQIPNISGKPYDLKITLPEAPWDNALKGDTLVAGGKKAIYIWTTLPLDGHQPDITFNNGIGNITFQNVMGVALDNQYFYVADASHKIFVWQGIPSTTDDTLFTINYDYPGRIYSDGEYLTVVHTDPQPSRVDIYKVANLSSNSVPFKEITNGIGHNVLNVPLHALTKNNHFFIVNSGYNVVDAWEDVNDAGDFSKVTVLGSKDTLIVSKQKYPPRITDSTFFSPGAMDFDGKYLWVGEFKFSSRILRFSYGPLTSVEDNKLVPKEFNLYQNYPNPFNPSTVINYRLSVPSKVTLKIYDILGREVTTLVNKEQPSGNYKVNFDASKLASGVYLYRIVAGDFVQTKKMVLLK